MRTTLRASACPAQLKRKTKARTARGKVRVSALIREVEYFISLSSASALENAG
jgi:hypothetical protein